MEESVKGVRVCSVYWCRVERVQACLACVHTVCYVSRLSARMVDGVPFDTALPAWHAVGAGRTPVAGWGEEEDDCRLAAATVQRQARRVVHAGWLLLMRDRTVVVGQQQRRLLSAVNNALHSLDCSAASKANICIPACSIAAHVGCVDERKNRYGGMRWGLCCCVCVT